MQPPSAHDDHLPPSAGVNDDRTERQLRGVAPLMSGVLVLVRIVLAAVLVVAAATKLLDQRGGCDGTRAFGIPDGLCAPTAVAVPLAELVIGAAHLLAPSARWAAVAAVGLLAALSLANRHRRPRAVSSSGVVT
jgi:uncharacterized membrane protein YphA (DoxX/SURF4 family)